MLKLCFAGRYELISCQYQEQWPLSLPMHAGTMRLEHLAKVANELKVLAGRLESQGSLARTRTADLLRSGSQTITSSAVSAQ